MKLKNDIIYAYQMIKMTCTIYTQAIYLVTSDISYIDNGLVENTDYGLRIADWNFKIIFISYIV